MTQQEIKENMTKGTWVSSNAYCIVEINKGSIDLWDIDEDRNIHDPKANALAITHAINNTYGKGINPESVPEMYNALQTLKAYFVDGENYEEICNILNKAAL